MRRRARLSTGLLLLMVLGALLYEQLGQLEVEYFYVPAPGSTSPSAGVEQFQIDHRITAWWLPCAKNQPTVIFLHGNGCNLNSTRAYFQAMQGVGIGVLAVDYRGYGTTPGTPSESGIVADALAGYH